MQLVNDMFTIDITVTYISFQPFNHDSYSIRRTIRRLKHTHTEGQKYRQTDRHAGQTHGRTYKHTTNGHRQTDKHTEEKL